MSSTYQQIERRFAAFLQRQASHYLAGTLSREELVRRFGQRLEQAQLAAFLEGRRAAGTLQRGVNEHEAAMLIGRHRREMQFFHKFVQDMDTGAGRMDYLKRAGLYAKSLGSLYRRAQSVDREDPELNARYYWVMDPEAEHCEDCIQRAIESNKRDGFTYDEMAEMGWPGERTRCGANCRCHVRVVKSQTLLPERIEGLTPVPAEEGMDRLESLLGGADMPILMPGAGVAGVKADPDVIQSAVRRYPGAQALVLLGLLPLLPLLFARPRRVEDDDDVRTYYGHGLQADTVRDAGVWRLARLILEGQPPRDWTREALEVIRA